MARVMNTHSGPPAKMLPHSPSDRHTSRDLLPGFVIAVHLGHAALSAWFGYLSPDSWTYLRLARNLYAQGYPGLDHAYFAVFPFGYPLLLALTSPGLDLVHTMIASKFVNAALWISIFFLLKRLRTPALVATALVVTPFVFQIGAMTWSENLMIFAMVLTLAGIDALQREKRPWPVRPALLLLGALLVGLSSRYMFGFVIGAYIVAYAIAYRREMRRETLIVLIAAELIFALYLAINLRLSGYMTGMARMPNTDGISYLAFTFARANYQAILAAILPFSFVALMAAREWRLSPLSLMAGLVGIAYVGIIAMLRLRSQFDPFDIRLLGPGWFLVAAAIALAAHGSAERGMRRLAAAALAVLALWSGYAAHGADAIDLATAHQLGTSPVAAFRDYAGAFDAGEETEAVISVGTPSPRATIAGDDRLYYGDLDVLAPGSAPFLPRETLDAFTSRLRSSEIDVAHCVIDFSRFASEDDLSEVLDDDYRVNFGRWERRFDPELTDRFRRIFRAKALVPCAAFMDTEKNVR
jgi:hypothetical protein